MTKNSLFALTLLLIISSTSSAQTTAFTYQGKLADINGNPLSGNYDFEFRLFDDLSGSAQHGTTQTAANILVTNGIFTVTLDFVNCSGCNCPTCFDGGPRFLAIAVKPAGGGSFTPLIPRQPITSTPYAIKSWNAATADGLACLNCVNSSQISSVSGSAVTGSIPVASVPAGSTNYIQNTTSQQATSNFNISGNGTAAGTLSAAVINANTHFGIAGLRVFSVNGSFNDGTTIFTNTNTFAGEGAGLNTTPNSDPMNPFGKFNSFFGAGAGQANTTGNQNDFFGTEAGRANTIGIGNAFFGRFGGFSNTSGNGNAFFGGFAGKNNTIGSGNAFFGVSAGVENLSGTNNTFIGFSADFNAVPPTGGNNTLLGAITRINPAVSSSTAIGAYAQVTQSNSLVLGSISGINNCTLANNCGSVNVGIGTTAPSQRLHVVGNALVTGNFTVNGTLNAGSIAANSVIGVVATANGGTGLSASGATGSYLRSNGTTWTSSALQAGDLTGTLATANGGTGLSAAGASGSYLRSNGSTWTSGAIQPTDLPAGSTNYIQNTTSQQATSDFNISGNGTLSGTLNAGVVNSTAQYNIGTLRALYINDSLGTNTNTFVGVLAGSQNPTGRFNSFFGCGAGQSTTIGGNNSFFGCGAGGQNQTGNDNAFFGRVAGQLNTANDNSFFGSFAGAANTLGTHNSFFGKAAGRTNDIGRLNSFFGTQSGFSNTTGEFNAFFGSLTGFANTTGSYNAFFGTTAGNSNTTGSDNTFFGTTAGNSNTTGSDNTFFGTFAGTSNTTSNRNTFIGARADFSVSNSAGNDNTLLGANTRVNPGVSNGTAIGADAEVAQSNSLVLGSNVNVGIGTPAPATKLHISGVGIVRARVDSDSNAGFALNLSNQPKWSVATVTGGHFQIYNDATGQNAVWIDSANNRVGIKTTSPSASLDVNGGMRLASLGAGGTEPVCRNSLNEFSTCSSSRRYKTNIAALHTGLNLISRLRPITFDWKQNGEHDLGLVAEEVAKVEPLLVTHNDKGEIEGVKYDRVGVVLINAVMEQQAQITDQQTQLNRQAKQIHLLEQQADQLRKLVHELTDLIRRSTAKKEDLQ